ncbi:hypothetical protein HZC09_00355 [Candidatus Micrarchaeota archaeon]|nr:hypothetical protein [Candidatus Micrarchaeota archaeon]
MKPSCRKLFLLLVFLTLSPLAHAQLKDAYKEETTIFHANQQYGLRFTYYEKDGAIGYMELALKKPGDVYRSCGSGFKGVTAESIGTATLAAIDAETLASTIYPERSCIPNEIRDLKEFLIKATRAEQNARKKLGKKISQYDIDAILAEYRPPDITEMSGQQAKTELENAISPEKAGAYWRCYDYNEYKKILESISKLTEANIAATIEHAKKQKETKQTAQKTPAQTQPTTPALKDDKNKETATTAQKKHPPAEAAIAKSAKKAAGKKEEQNEKAVLVYFNIEPKGAETKPKEAEMPESEDFTLKNLVFAKESEWQGFEYSMGFKDNLGVENYDIRASKIASYDLKEIYPVGEREIYNIQPEKKIGKENKGLAVNSHALTEGIWKIMVVAKTKDGKKTVSTYWKPEYSKYLLDGVIAIAPNSYADKRDYELKTEARRCELLYKEKAETVCPLSKKVREKREEVDAHLQKMNGILETDSKGEKIEEFKYNNQQFLRERENLAAESVKLIAAVNGEKSEKAKEFKTRIYNSLWLQKLIYYLGTEKSLVEKKMSLCSNSWLDKSLLTFKESVYASKLEGLESGYGCNKGSEEELTYKLAYLNYILNNLAKYEKDLTEGKTAQTLEEAIANLRVNFPAYLRWETEKADNALENLEKANEKIVVKENGETYVKVSGAMIFTGLKEREFEDGILVKLNKNTCYTIPAMHAESNSDGSNEMSDDVRTINIFCAPYTAKLIAETALKHPYAKNKLQAEGSNVLLTHVKFSDWTAPLLRNR